MRYSDKKELVVRSAYSSISRLPISELIPEYEHAMAELDCIGPARGAVALELLQGAHLIPNKLFRNDHIRGVNHEQIHIL